MEEDEVGDAMDDEFDEEELRQEFQMSHNNQANKRHQHP
jgi:hypothetical protein